MKEKVNVTVYLEIASKEDEKKWKEFLRYYFPNHYAKDILDKDLVVEQTDGWHESKRIGVSVDGFGWLSAMCLHYAPKELFIPIDNFDEFMKTDIYQQIVSRGPTFEVGSPQIIPFWNY